MIRWTTPVSRKRITYHTEHVGTTKIRRVIVHKLNTIILGYRRFVSETKSVDVSNIRSHTNGLPRMNSSFCGQSAKNESEIPDTKFQARESCACRWPHSKAAAWHFVLSVPALCVIPFSVHFQQNHFVFDVSYVTRQFCSYVSSSTIYIEKSIPKFRRPRLSLISNFRLVLNVVCFLLDHSPASEFYTPTFRNALSVPSS